MAADDIYHGTAEFYDFVVPYRERPDVPFYVEEARRAGGMVLEVGCGTGRILIPTARAGVNITGLDMSGEMLQTCRASLARESPGTQERANLHQGDMRSFDLGRAFSLITVPFRAFQHLLTVEDQVACLRTLWAHLETGGLLILDLFNPWLEYIVNTPLGVETGDEPEFTMPDGRRVLRRSRVTARDPFRQVNDIELVYHVTHPDGREEAHVHAFPMRYLFRYEAEHLLSRCGYELEELYSDYERNPFGAIEPGELLFLARKR